MEIKKFLKIFGPGVVAGAADDDPSGIGTYSVAGAKFGYTFLWTAILTWPLMAVVQMACARIGMVTGRGLSSALERKIPRPILVIFSVSLFFANTLNVGADLSAMADAAELFSGVNSHYFIIIFGLGISWATVKLRYSQISMGLKWLALFLFSYIITAFVVGPNWKEVFNFTFIPHLPRNKEEWSMLVAILGTTISPYLFYWQSSQEVEEEKSMGRNSVAKRKNASAEELGNRRIDVGVGTLFSNIVMFFVILTTALTLHKAGITNIETSKQAAEALRPLAGNLATALYTMGLLGVGFLAIPTLTGSAAYALAETFRWRQGLDAKINKAKAFYAVIIFSTLLAIIMDFSKLNPIKALYWSAVVNGVLAPFLLVGVLMVTSDNQVMEGQRSSKISRAVIFLTMLAMFFCAGAMFFL